MPPEEMPKVACASLKRVVAEPRFLVQSLKPLSDFAHVLFFRLIALDFRLVRRNFLSRFAFRQFIHQRDVFARDAFQLGADFRGAFFSGGIGVFVAFDFAQLVVKLLRFRLAVNQFGAILFPVKILQIVFPQRGVGRRRIKPVEPQMKALMNARRQNRFDRLSQGREQRNFVLHACRQGAEH